MLCLPTLLQGGLEPRLNPQHDQDGHYDYQNLFQDGHLFITYSSANGYCTYAGITAYLLNGGELGHAQQIAAHESPRTTKLYDRRRNSSKQGGMLFPSLTQ